jgi:hypothetical protein
LKVGTIDHLAAGNNAGGDYLEQFDGAAGEHKTTSRTVNNDRTTA